jgi:hypothetical protein
MSRDVAYSPPGDHLRVPSGGRGWPGSHGTSRYDRRPATTAELLEALTRIRSEAALLAEKAYDAIQHHAYDPYREFVEKRAEYAALVSVLRSRLGPKSESSLVATADRHDRALTTLSIQACLKFSFALSATPLMPIGARETFIHELEMLKGAREQLTRAKDEEGVSALLDDIETSLMILEEIVERAPALEEF